MKSRKQTGVRKSIKRGKLDKEEAKCKTTSKETSGITSHKKSTLGTKPTGTNNRPELLDIIEGCRNLGVSKIKTSDFEVEFFLERSLEVGRFEAVDGPIKPKAIDKDLLDDMRLSQLMIDDPFGFEKEILNAEQRRVTDETFEN